MTGKEIAEICEKHGICEGCELEDLDVCDKMIYYMEHANPSDIFNILAKDYGGSEE